jgi:hypothetical protein
VGEISHINVTYWNDNFDFKNRQVTLALPIRLIHYHRNRAINNEKELICLEDAMPASHIFTT